MYVQIDVHSKTTAIARANVSVCTSTHVFFEHPLLLSLQVKQNNKDLSYLYTTIQSATARTPTILIYSKTTASEGKQVAGSPLHGGSAAATWSPSFGPAPGHWVVDVTVARVVSVAVSSPLGEDAVGAAASTRQIAWGHRGRVVAQPWPPSRRR